MKKKTTDGSSKKSNRASSLGSITGQGSNNGSTTQVDLNKVTIDDYEEIKTSPAMKKKHKELGIIINKIEKQKPKEVKIPEFGPEYKVDYRKELNDKQLEAVVSTEGPVLVIAGAGTGKTHLLVYRTIYLIESGIEPEEVLLLTFTRKAAKEMIDRVNGLRHDSFYTEVSGGTFHSMALNIIRQHPDKFNLKPNFTVADTSRSQAIIDLARSDLGLNKRDVDFPAKKRVYEIISESRNTQVEIKDVIEKKYIGLKDHGDDIIRVFDWYQEFKANAHNVDFDDLMIMLRDKLKEDDGFRSLVQGMFRYIMVDEYQDTNVVQSELVNLMVNEDQNIMVVGDDAQSIYAFRGANYENILRFPDTYPDCSIIKLDVNYRSTQQILDFTNSVNNSFKIGYKKHLTANRSHKGKRVKVNKFYNQEDEAKFIVRIIRDHHEKGIPYSKMAVLCRSSCFWKKIELELNKFRIPYVTVGGVRFAEKDHIQDVMAYLTVLYNPLDAVAWHQILKLEKGVGPKITEKVVTEINENDGKLDTVNSIDPLPHNVSALMNMITSAGSDKVCISDKIDLIKAHYKPILQGKDNKSKNAMMDISVFQQFADGYDDLGKLLSDFRLDSFEEKFANDIKPSRDETEEGFVTLSTVHSAKGLEWGIVFVPHALDGLFPSTKSMNDVEDLEEEHRVFYVAVSRAKDRLFITMPSSVGINGGFYSLPSRFLVQVDKTTLKNKNIKSTFKRVERSL